MNAKTLREEIRADYSSRLDKGRGWVKELTQNPDGYDNQELQLLPDDAVENSFGCGNPLAFTNIKPGDCVVDLGSGAGLDVLLAADKVGPQGRVIGIDMTSTMVAKARSNILQSGVESFAEIRQGMIESVPAESGTADWVISNCVLSLSPDKPAVLREVYRLLKPGGWMSISDIVVDHIPPWISLFAGFYSTVTHSLLNEDQYLHEVSLAGMINAKIDARLVYDRLLLEGGLKDQLNKEKPLRTALLHRDKPQILANLYAPIIQPVAKRLDGKVASIRVIAQKPNVVTQ
ncbi:hypothetical protein A9Q99_00105 [Gammaproteobacteria bacterium 45_16_T64]|nr:hypothetical protein A9Q99_00105 [Gammaproteobacteria bacterium 45_16_T64]